MSQEEEKKMGLFRFTIISPLLSDDPRPLLTRFEDLAKRIWTLPNGTLRQFSAATIEDWYYDYRKYGIDALIHPPRRDKGTHRALTQPICQAIQDVLK